MTTITKQMSGPAIELLAGPPAGPIVRSGPPRRGLRALMLSTTLAAGMAMTVFSTQDAIAQCVESPGVSPDTIVCNGADNDGVLFPSNDVVGVNVDVNGLASVTNAGLTTVIDIDLTVGGVLNFTQDNLSTIAGAGAGIIVDTTNAATQNWTLNGVLTSAQSVALTNNLAAGGTVDMTIGTTGIVSGQLGGIIVQNTGGALDLGFTNNGQMYSPGGGAISINDTSAAAGVSTIDVTNTGIMGQLANPLGTTGIAINSTNTNVGTAINVTNDGTGNPLLGAGTIYSTSHGILVVQAAGTTDVTNAGSITSTGGAGIVVQNAGTGLVDVSNVDGTIAGGTGGISVLSGGAVDVDNSSGAITTTNGAGIAVDAAGAVTVDSTTGSITTVNGTGIIAETTSGNVLVDAGLITTTGASAAVASTEDGNATVNVNEKISVSGGGLFGAAAFADDNGAGGDGAATVNVLADIDPPIVGALAVSIGAGPALVDIAADVTVAATGLGAGVANFGTGTATIDNEGSIVSDFAGAGGLKIGSGGALTINNIGADSSIVADEIGVVMVALDFGVGDQTATLNNDGLIQGNGVFTPVIIALTDGGVTINNELTGVIQGNQGALGSAIAPFEPMILTIGGAATINNDGDITGSVTLLSGAGATGNVFNNNFSGEWDVGGFNTMGIGGDDVLNNEGFIYTNGFTVFDFNGGTNIVNNLFFGVIEADGFTVFSNLTEFNNAGFLSMADDAIDDVTIIDGLYDGQNGVLAVDAALGLGGSSDLLFIEGGATGQTFVAVNDLLPGVAASYDPVGFLVIDVDGGVDGQPNFILANGPIDKGFFDYDLYFVPGIAGVDDQWWLANAPNARAFEMAKLATGVQEVWHQSAHTWLDRTADLRPYLMGNSGPAKVGPGIWVRSFGAFYDRDAKDSVRTAGGSNKIKTEYDQNIYGIQVGADFQVMSTPNSALLLGVMGGYTWSDMDFSTGSDADLKGFNVGAYATYMVGGFFADLLFKADFIDVNYKADFAGGGKQSDKTDALSLGASLDLGYRFGENQGLKGFFVEPMATISYVHTEFDKMSLMNSGVDIKNAESLRGRLGLRGGMTFVSNRTRIEPFLQGSLWNEFLGDNDAVLSGPGGSVKVDDDNGGMWGEVGGGINIMDIGGGLSGFLKADYRFGNELEGPSVKGGIRYTFGRTAPVVAAVAPPPPPVEAKKNFLVFFDFDRSNITADAQRVIEQAAAAAKAGNTSRIQLTGHTDRSGSDQYNMALSLRRGEAVKQALIRLGIPAASIAVIGRGESQPLVPTADGVREPQNRRVEILL